MENISYKQLQERVEELKKENKQLKEVLENIQKEMIKFTGIRKDMPVIVFRE